MNYKDDPVLKGDGERAEKIVLVCMAIVGALQLPAFLWKEYKQKKGA